MKIYISQGSVATQLIGGGIRSNHFITNFPQNVSVKNFENPSIFVQDMDKSMWLSFLAHPVDLKNFPGGETPRPLLTVAGKVRGGDQRVPTS